MESEAGMENRVPLGPLTPSQQNSESKALDFSKLTPSQFGITTNSFTALPKHKDKSRVAQLKARRRSTIGIRGSPETNSLICFRAKQHMKTPPRTPQHLLESPLFSGRDSIKQKMAAFQRLMGTDEENTEQSTSSMKDEEGVRHAQSDGSLEASENWLAPVTPPLSKRCRRGTPHRSVWEEKIEEEPLSEHTHTPIHQQQEEEFEFNSQKAESSLGSQLMSLPMLSKPELIKTGDIEVSSVSTKKRVRFGAPLSPEFFDKTLPPSTPLQKGATPAAPPSSTGRKHSLLKTPQRFEEPLPQPDFSSPEENEASLVVTTTHSDRDGGPDKDEVLLDHEKIIFPIMDEEYDNLLVDVKGSAEIIKLTTDIKVTDAACTEEPLSGLSFITSHDSPAADAELDTEAHQLLKTAESSTESPRPRGRKRKQPTDKQVTETRRSSRTAAVSAKGKMKVLSAKKRFGTKEVDRSLYGKRNYASKNPHLSPIIESATCSLISTPTNPHSDENPDSSAATPPHTKQSNTASSSDATADLLAAAALWRQRFLPPNEERDTAGNLTDAPVQLESSVGSSVASSQRRASTGRAVKRRRKAAGQHRRWSSANAKDVHEDESEGGEQKTEVNQSESTQKESPAGEQSASEILNQKAERSSGVKSPGRGRKRGRKSAGMKNRSVEEEEGPIEEIHQDTGESSGCEKDEEKNEGFRETTERPVEKNEEDLSETTEREVKEKKGEDMLQTTGHEVEEKNEEDIRPMTGCEVEEKIHETLNPCSALLETLEPWQQPDFCIEDILKPITKSRGSVRRSLRHRRSMDVLSKGLAWVEHTSPQMVTTYQRRKTCGRLSMTTVSLPGSEESSTNY